MSLHTVIETDSYLADAKHVGMTEEERTAAVNAVARAPEGGDLVRNSGGLRKVRVAGRGKGKSGGFRVLALYLGRTFPALLIAVLSKGERGNFSGAELSAFRVMAERIKAGLERKRK